MLEVKDGCRGIQTYEKFVDEINLCIDLVSDDVLCTVYVIIKMLLSQLSNVQKNR